MTSKPNTEIEGLRISGNALQPRADAGPIASFPFAFTASALFGRPNPLPAWASPKGR